MNRVILCGRLCKEPEVRYTQGEHPTCIARYSLAVDRKVKKEGEANADFINCIAFGKNGEFAEKWLTKGMKIIVEGHIQTGMYLDKDNKRVYTTDVVIEGHEFVEGRKETTKAEKNDGFMNVPDSVEEAGLPFN